VSECTLRVLGKLVRPLERITVAGEILGLTSRSTAYRLAESDAWPMCGPPNSRFVLMIPLLQRYGLPFEVVSESGAQHDDRA
jgi:hypothetical protein